MLGINNCQNGDDNLPYATLNYASGPGHQLNMFHGSRQNLNKLDIGNNVSIDFHPPNITATPPSLQRNEEI